MLVPIQTSGNKPPLFFLHGQHGIMPLGPLFARVLGPDQPLYVIQANGIDGCRPVIDNIPDMVQAYVEEIHNVRPIGPLVIGGMCAGCLATIEVARTLEEKGRQLGALMLADPPPNPFATSPLNRPIDLRQPQVMQQLYQGVRGAFLSHASSSHHDMPFDSGDADQLHAATLAGIGAATAFSSYVARPYLGPAELIVSVERAAAFFHPEMPWSKLLPGPRMVHVLPWHHAELFLAGRESVARLLKLMLEEAPGLETLAQQQMESTPA